MILLDVVFGCRIEAAHLRRRRPADQAIGADDALGPFAAATVEHQQVIAHLVERIEVALLRRHLGRRMGRHLLVEDAIAQRLRRVDLGGRLRQTDLEVTGDDLDDLPIGYRRSKKLGFAVSTVNAHELSARGPPRSSGHYRGGKKRVHSFLPVGFPVQGHAVQFETMADQPVSGLLGDPPLQVLDLVVVEFDDLAGLDVDQMIVVLARASLRSARGRRRNRAWPGCPLPRTDARCGRPWRSRCSDRPRWRACATPRHRDGRTIRTAPAR